MQLRGFGWRSAAAVSGLDVLMICAVIGGRVITARISDESVKRREETVVANGMNGWMKEAEARVVGQTTWDDAVQNLSLKFDPAWAHKNIGQFLHDSGGFERAFVLDGGDVPVYAMTGGADRPAEIFSQVEKVAAPLIHSVREIKIAAGHRTTRHPYVMPPPAQASTFALLGDQPAIVSVSLVQSDFGTYLPKGRAPLVVTAEHLDADLMRRFSARFLLANFHLARPTDDLHKWATTELRDQSGPEVTRLAWSPQTPGRSLLFGSAPILVAALAVFLMIAAGLFRSGRRATQALIASEQQALHLAYHDPLTGLPNRARFADRMAHALTEMRRSSRPVAVLLIDLDRFKDINDTYGHTTGDELITEVAQRLRRVARDADTLVRLGGDEFALILTDTSPSGAAIVAARILQVFAESFKLSAGEVFSQASIGITLVDNGNIDGAEALRQAELALYRAKDNSRREFTFFESEMDLALKAKRGLEADLRLALATGELSMAYQPQVDRNGVTTGVEALVRWRHAERGQVSPACFVPIAEECGLIGALGDFTLRRAFLDSLRWPGLTVAINISAIQLRSTNFAGHVAAILAETGAKASQIELEITEGVLLGDDMATHATLDALREQGFSLALDDFGTGYSSLSYLRQYPIDKIKIDRCFVTNLGLDADSDAVVSAIVKLARALNLRIIAEGVETNTQRTSLHKIGCFDIQGFLYSKPLDRDEVTRFIRKNPKPQPKRA